jgi:hypothetical protein
MTLGERLERAIKVLIAMQGLDNTLYSLRTAIDESSFSDLHLRAAIMRRRLEVAVDRYGLGDPLVLAMSRKLDRLLVQLQRRKVA